MNLLLANMDTKKIRVFVFTNSAVTVDDVNFF